MISTAILSLLMFADVEQGYAQVGQCFECNAELINPCEGSHDGWEECAQPEPGKCELTDPSCEGGFAALEIAPSGGVWVPSEIRSFASRDASAFEPQQGPQEVRGCGDSLLMYKVTSEQQRAFRGSTATIIL